MRSAASVETLIGSVIAERFLVEAELGSGAMGTVFRARHVKFGRLFAIKVLHPELVADPAIRARFEREAELAARLTHRNVVPVLDNGQLPDGSYYLVMEFADGVELGALLDRPLPAARVIHLARQLCDGLHHAHLAGLIHRDFKPANVIVTTDRDGSEVPRIVDFGIALAADQPARITSSGMILGTPEYMAPELALDQPLDHRIDLFALGVIVYEMLTGVMPFEGSGVEVVHANLSMPTPAMATRAPGVVVDPLLEAFTRKLLQKPRELRPDTALAARQLLDQIATDRAGAAAVLGVGLRPEMTRSAMIPILR